MLRRSFILLSDSYKDFSLLLMNKLKSSKTALELQSSVKNMILEESHFDMKKLPSKMRVQLAENPKHAKHYVDGRRVTVVNTLLTQCQTHKLWQQAIVVFTTALSMQVPVKPNWEKMVLASAPDAKARNEIRMRLNLHHEESSSSTNSNVHNVHHQQHHHQKGPSAQNQSDTTRRRDDHDDIINADASSMTNSLQQIPANNKNAVAHQQQQSANFFELSTTAAASASSSSSSLSNFRSAAIAHIPVNPLFDQYYLKQKLVKNGTELALLTESLKKRPITCFRVNLSYPGWQVVSAAALQLPFVEPVPWYPSSSSSQHHQLPVAFQIDFDHFRRSVVKKGNDYDAQEKLTSDNPKVSESEFIKTRDWMKKMSQDGFISIQSPSSLLVGSLVDPTPSDVVLDMCAAPGSKTRQIVDGMNLATLSSSSSSSSQTTTTSLPFLPSGVVIANEASSSRHHLLSHLLCTNGRMTNVAITRSRGEGLSVFSQLGRWDKILVDAPCSGEGMLHKFPNQWSTWTPSWGLQHHQNQVALLKRAVELLKEGGKIVYSTCTMNPLENEAVVAAVLDHFGWDVLEVEEIPRDVWYGLKNMERGYASASAVRQHEQQSSYHHNSSSSFLSRGLREWVIPISSSSTHHQQQQPYAFISSSDLSKMNKKEQQKLLGASSSTLLPQKHNHQNQQDDYDDQQFISRNLSRCIRITPSNHSGFDAFFVTILRKKKSSSFTATPPLLAGQRTNSSSSSFSKTLSTAVQEAKRLKTGNSQAQPIISEIMKHFLNGVDDVEAIIQQEENNQKFILEQRNLSSSTSSAEQQELLLTSQEQSRSTKEELLVKSTSAKPLVLRSLSAKAWQLATCDDSPIPVVCPGNVFAHVWYSSGAMIKKNTRISPSFLSSSLQQHWKLSHFGANVIGSLALSGRNNDVDLMSIISHVPLTVLRMILSANQGKVQNVEKELMADDIDRIQKGKDYDFDDEDDADFDSDEDELQKRRMKFEKRPLWQKKMLLKTDKTTTPTSPRQVIIHSQLFNSTTNNNNNIFIPCELIIDDNNNNKKRSLYDDDDDYIDLNFASSAKEVKLTCHLDHGERKRLLLLLSQLAQSPKKFDSPAKNKWKPIDRTTVKQAKSYVRDDFNRPKMAKNMPQKREVFEV